MFSDPRTKKRPPIYLKGDGELRATKPWRVTASIFERNPIMNEKPLANANQENAVVAATTQAHAQSSGTGGTSGGS
jgi:hypothetical protein